MKLDKNLKKKIPGKHFLRILLVFIILFGISCGPKNEPVDIANKFVKYYYQRMNQEEAIKLSSMMAKDKLEKEIELVKESRIKNPQAEQNKAKISYNLEESKIEKDMGFITYKLIIQPKGMKPFNKSALLTLKNESGQWKIINYEEINPE